MKRRKRIVDNSDIDSDAGSESEDSDNAINSSKPAPKKKPTARKRGRPSVTAKKKTLIQQDDSDDGGLPSTRPSSPQSDNDHNSSDSDYVPDSTNGSKRGRGRPSAAASNKKQRLQNGNISRDTSPQPSTSYQTHNGTCLNTGESDIDSDSNSADSDLGLFNERSLVKKKKPAEKKQSQKMANKRASNFANNGAKLPTHDASADAQLVESLAQKLVYFLLIEDNKKYAIRRKGIIAHVFREHQSEYSPKLYTAVIKKANIILKKIYGMELMELENQKDSYLIVNILRRELGIHDYVDVPRIKQQQHGLISFLLTVIFMNENVITEDELTRCLKPLGIDLTSKRMHPVFGDVKKYISTELVKQMYLNYECISKDPPKYEYTWGLRAKQEFDKRDLLQFVCTIMDDTAPEDWRIQFRDAEASAKTDADS